MDNCFLLPVCAAVGTILKRRPWRILFNLRRPCSAEGGRSVHKKPPVSSPPRVSWGPALSKEEAESL